MVRPRLTSKESDGEWEDDDGFLCKDFYTTSTLIKDVHGHRLGPMTASVGRVVTKRPCLGTGEKERELNLKVGKDRVK